MRDINILNEECEQYIDIVSDKINLRGRELLFRVENEWSVSCNEELG